MGLIRKDENSSSSGGGGGGGGGVSDLVGNVVKGGAKGINRARASKKTRDFLRYCH